jgi:peptidoglycan-associated lipoprotein
MENSPRPPLPLLLCFTALCLAAGAGCSGASGNAPLKPPSLQITPKAQPEEKPRPHTAAERAAYAFSGAIYGLKTPDVSAWTPEEIKDAQFIHAADIYFYYDEDTLTPDAQDVLRQKADKIMVNPHFYVTIVGHGDERGSESYNLELGRRRAMAAFNFLLRMGVPANRLSTISMGKKYPRTDGRSEDALGQNRRNEFFVGLTAAE